MVWLSIPPKELLYAAPIAFGICAFWLVFTLFKRQHTQLPSVTASVQPHIPSAPTPTKVERNNAYAEAIKFTCFVGALWEQNIEGRDFKLTVHGISKIKNQSEYRADVEL